MGAVDCIVRPFASHAPLSHLDQRSKHHHMDRSSVRTSRCSHTLRQVAKAMSDAPLANEQHALALHRTTEPYSERNRRRTQHVPIRASQAGGACRVQIPLLLRCHHWMGLLAMPRGTPLARAKGSGIQACRRHCPTGLLSVTSTGDNSAGSTT
jgi:hypothetical protein